MQPNTIIETIGKIEKKETIVSVENNDMVLESLHPFPGYHGTTIPDQTNPKSIFLVMKSKERDEDVIRKTAKVRAKFSSNFDASPGVITIFNKLEPCIRIKDLENYALISELISLYKEEGITFQKGKNISSYYGWMRIKKFFIIDEVNDGIYMDKDTPEMGYFEVPTKLDWDVFEKITVDLKHNIEDNNFDAALGTLYRKTGLKDIIRIYDTNVCLGECLFLRDKYLTEIKKHL
jgi:hypothetical protein